MYTSVVVMNFELSRKDVVLQLVACMQYQLQTLDDRCVGSVKSELQPLHDSIMCRLASLRGGCDWTLTEKQDVVVVMTAFNQLLPLTFMGVGEGVASGQKGPIEDHKKSKMTPERKRFEQNQGLHIVKLESINLENRGRIADMERYITKLERQLIAKENASEKRDLYKQIRTLTDELQEANKSTETWRNDAQSAETRNEEITKQMEELVSLTDQRTSDNQKQVDKSQKSNNVEMARVQEALARVRSQLVESQNDTQRAKQKTSESNNVELARVQEDLARARSQLVDKQKTLESNKVELGKFDIRCTDALDKLNVRFVELITFTGDQKKLFNTIQNSLDTSMRVVQGDEDEETMPDFSNFKKLLDTALSKLGEIKNRGGDGGGNIEAVQQALAIVEKLEVDVQPHRENPSDGAHFPGPGTPIVERTYGAACKIDTACDKFIWWIPRLLYDRNV
jgi:hypothetical protein